MKNEEFLYHTLLHIQVFIVIDNKRCTQYLFIQYHTQLHMLAIDHGAESCWHIRHKIRDQKQLPYVGDWFRSRKIRDQKQLPYILL